MIYPISTVQTAYQQYAERMMMKRNRPFSYSPVHRLDPSNRQTESNRFTMDNRKNHLSPIKNSETNGLEKKGRYIDYYA